VIERQLTVRVVVTTSSPTSPNVVCPQIGFTSRPTLTLRSPLAGRQLLGRWSVVESNAAHFEHVPRLIGLAPSDAGRVVIQPRYFGHIHWRVAERIVPTGIGLPRVIAQEPAPGKPLENGHVLCVVIAERR
jgi:hypothetical protein